MYITFWCNTYAIMKLFSFTSTFVEKFSGLARILFIIMFFPTVVPGGNGNNHWTADSNERVFLQPEARGDGSYHSTALMLNLLKLFFSNKKMCLLRHVYGPAYDLFWRRFHVLERNAHFVVGWSDL